MFFFLEQCTFSVSAETAPTARDLGAETARLFMKYMYLDFKKFCKFLRFCFLCVNVRILNAP